jgi:hypothetical protein
MRLPDNIDASAFHLGQYVGYGPDHPWRIRRDGRWWSGTEQGWPFRVKRTRTLVEMGQHIASLPRVCSNPPPATTA